MESKNVNWLIEYKVVDSGKVQSMKISLQFNKEKNIAKWFKMAYNGQNGKKHYEFLKAKIIE